MAETLKEKDTVDDQMSRGLSLGIGRGVLEVFRENFGRDPNLSEIDRLAISLGRIISVSLIRAWREERVGE